MEALCRCALEHNLGGAGHQLRADPAAVQRTGDVQVLQQCAPARVLAEDRVGEADDARAGVGHERTRARRWGLQPRGPHRHAVARGRRCRGTRRSRRPGSAPASCGRGERRSRGRRLRSLLDIPRPTRLSGPALFADRDPMAIRWQTFALLAVLLGVGLVALLHPRPRAQESESSEPPSYYEPTAAQVARAFAALHDTEGLRSRHRTLREPAVLQPPGFAGPVPRRHAGLARRSWSRGRR